MFENTARSFDTPSFSHNLPEEALRKTVAFSELWKKTRTVEDDVYKSVGQYLEDVIHPKYGEATQDVQDRLGKAFFLAFGFTIPASSAEIDEALQEFPELQELQRLVKNQIPGKVDELRALNLELQLAAEQLLPELEQAFVEIKADFQRRIDYRAALEKYIHDDKTSEFFFTFLRAVNYAFGPLVAMENSVSRVSLLIHRFEKCQKLYEEYLPTSSSSAMHQTDQLIPEEAVERVSAITVLEGWVKDLHAYEKLADRYKRFRRYKYRHYEGFKLSRVMQYLKNMLYRGGEELDPAIANNEQAARAIVEVLGQEAQELTQKGQLRGQDKEKMVIPELKALPFPVDGLDPVEGYSNFVTTEKIWKKFSAEGEDSIGTMLPPGFFKGIDAVHFVEDPEMAAEGDIKIDPFQLLFLLLMKQHEVMEVLVHEIFEQVRHQLTLEEMEAWDRIVEEEDPNSPTWYVEYCKVNADNEDYKLSSKEDFCESAAMFYTSPFQLKIVSPARYRFMRQLFVSRMPISQQEQYLREIDTFVEQVVPQRFQKVGSTEEQFKQSVTTHQTVDKESFREKPEMPRIGTPTGGNLFIDFDDADFPHTEIYIYVPPRLSNKIILGSFDTQ